MKYNYYPGCSLEKSASSYDVSTRAIAPALGIEFMEVEDWNCCGATEYIALNRMAAYALTARNLALASKNKESDQLIAPCSACYLNLRKCNQYLYDDEPLAKNVNIALAEGGLSYEAGSLRVRHLLDIVVNDVGYDAIQAKVTKPLTGLRIAPYYGCLIVRPDFGRGKHKSHETTFDNPEYPTSLDKLLKVLGAEVVDFPYKAHYCGGHMTQISDATGFEIIRRLIKGASDYRADMVVTLCPMCQMNLDAFQGAVNVHFKTNYHMPVLFFTQMIGLAFGMSAQEMGIGTELVDARPALAKIGVEVPPPEDEGTVKKPKKDDKSLPMPRLE